MTEEFNIGHIKEFQKEIQEYRELKKLLKRKRTKINSLVEKYDFIKATQSIDINDFELEIKILELLKDIGYRTTKPSTTRDLDGYAEFNGETIGIEAKNSKGISENDMFQGLKYKGRKGLLGLNIRVIIVWNNSKTNDTFDKERILDSEINDYGIITTDELVRGFIKVKNGNITIDTFHKLLTKSGLIKFSSKKIKELG